MVALMDRWLGKVAIVTGASAGIGAEIAKKLVENGMIVAGLARRKEKIELLSKTLQNKKGQLHAIKCDISVEEEILNAFKWIQKNLGPVHVLINNAAVLQQTSLADGDTQMWKKVIETNIIGLCVTTREAIKVMKSNNINGHIVQLNSIVGHYIPSVLSSLNVYPATKYAVTALSETLRLELAHEGSKIKVTSVSPGPTESEIIEAAGINPKNLDTVFVPNKILLSEDVADAVVYCLATPPHVQVKELILKHVGEKF